MVSYNQWRQGNVLSNYITYIFTHKEELQQRVTNTIEIDFDLKINGPCQSVSCNIFALKTESYLGSVYLPAISILQNNEGLNIIYPIESVSKTAGYMIINDSSLLTALNDGKYHNYYFKLT
eukprot:149962_1